MSLHLWLGHNELLENAVCLHLPELWLMISKENCSPPPFNSVHTTDPNTPKYFLSQLLWVYVPGRDKFVAFYLRDNLKYI